MALTPVLMLLPIFIDVGMWITNMVLAFGYDEQLIGPWFYWSCAELGPALLSLGFPIWLAVYLLSSSRWLNVSPREVKLKEFGRSNSPYTLEELTEAQRVEAEQ